MHSHSPCDARSRCPGFDFVWLDYCGTLGLGPLSTSVSIHLQSPCNCKVIPWSTKVLQARICTMLEHLHIRLY